MQNKYLILKLAIVSITIFVLFSNAADDSYKVNSDNTVRNNQLFTESQYKVKKTAANLTTNKDLKNKTNNQIVSDQPTHISNTETSQFKKYQPSANFTPLNQRTFNPKPPLAVSNINIELLDNENLKINLPFIEETNASLSQKQETKQLTHAVFRFTDIKGSLSVSYNDNGIEELTLYDADANRVFTGNQSKNGSVSFREKNIDNFICNDFEHVSTSTNITSLSGATALAEIEDDYFTEGSIPTFAEITALQSKPSASKVIYIDNLGGTVVDTWWNENVTEGAPINYDPYDIDGDTTTFVQGERLIMYAAWAELAEDYAPFEVNVTTDITVYNAASPLQRSRIIATSSSAWIGGGGGVALVNVFGNNFCSITEEYCSIGWTFNAGYGSMGMTHSHESGHQMGLSHDGDNNGAYYNGHGNWGSIMGAPFGKDFAQWSIGSYTNATNDEDDFDIVSNKLGVSADDVGDTNASATVLTGDLVGLITPKGSGTTLDKDVFTFNVNGTTPTSIIVRSLFEDDFSGNGGVNLSAKISLKNAAGTTIEEKLPTSTSTNNNFEYNDTLASGTYFLTVEPQSYDPSPVTGFDEYGNGGYYQILSNIALSIEPDLVVNSFSTSSSQAFTGSSITLNAVAQNNGGTTSNPTTLRYYRSTDTTIGTNDTPVGTDDIASLVFNTTSNASININVPNTPGTYYYGACVDSVTDEVATNNNCSTGVAVTVVSPPDLTVSSFSTSESTIIIGKQINLSATTRNIGGFASNASTLRYYRSSNSTISTNDTLIGTDSVNRLSVNVQENDSISIDVPNTIGTYYYGACVNAVTDETITNNNCSTGVAVTVFSPPDLIVENISSSSNTVIVGKSFTLSATTRNQGGFTSTDTQLRYRQSSDSNITTADTIVGSDDIASLSNNAQESDIINLAAPSSPGTYYYGACTENVTDETNTNNNCSSSVAISVVTAPDLNIASISSNLNTVIIGQQIRLTAISENLGGFTSTASTLNYYLSNDSTIFTNDSQIGSDPVNALNSNAQEQDTINITAENTPGTYYYGACLETVTDETVINNNCSESVAITVVSPPDLIIESFSTSTTTITAGTNLTLSATTKNDGGFSSSTSNLQYYRSTDNVITTGDFEVDTDTVGILGASESENDSSSITVPSVAGTYYYGVCVDNVANETATTNNCSDAVAVTVTEQTFPDLLTDNLNVSKVRLTTSTPLDIVVTVRNAGSESSTATSVKFFISSNSVISFKDDEIASFNIPALTVNNSLIESTVITTPDIVGDYYFGACVVEDANEEDINNNCSAGVLVEVVQGYEVDSFEPNDSPDQSIAISNNETQTHSIHTLDDEDWLSFDIKEDTDNLAISIASLNADNIEFQLFDESLNSVDTIADASLESIELENLAAGTYYVQVKTIDGENAVESYEVNLSHDEVEDDFCFPIKAKNGKVAVICL